MKWSLGSSLTWFKVWTGTVPAAQSGMILVTTALQMSHILINVLLWLLDAWCYILTFHLLKHPPITLMAGVSGLEQLGLLEAE